MALTNLSQVTSSGIHTLSDYTTRNINSTGIITATSFSGNLSSASGISTFAEIRVTGNLTVEGTTTTLDSVLTEVDRLEIGANTAAVGLALTQSGSGHAATFEGGNVGIGTDNPGATLHVRGSSSPRIENTGTISLIRFQNSSAENVFYGSDADNAVIYTQSTERLRITSGGSVGIGTVSPTADLEIEKPTSASLEVGNTLGQRVRIEGGSSGISFNTPNALNMTFGTSNTERLRITSGGNVGIGLTNPQNLLHIKSGTSGASSYDSRFKLILENSGEQYIGFYNNDNSYSGIRFNNTTINLGTIDYYYTQNYLYFYSNGGYTFNTPQGGGTAERLRITSSGNIGIGTDNPISELMVENATQSHITVKTSGSNMAKFGSKGNDVYVGGTAGAANIIFKRNITSTDHPADSGTETLRITSGGKVTITTDTNTASPATGGDNLVIKDSDGSGISIFSGDGNSQNIYMGSTSDNDCVRLEGFYNSGSPYFNIYTAGSERLRITSSGQFIMPAGTFDLMVGDSSDSNAGTQTISVGSTASGASGGIQLWANPTNGNSYIQFGDNSASASQYRGWVNYQHTNDNLNFGTAGAEKLRITSSGHVGVGTDNPGVQAWRSGKVLDIHGGAGNVTGELHLGANRGDGVQSVGSINFYDNTQDSTHRHVAVIESDKDGTTANKRGGQLVFYTKSDNVAVPTERLRINAAGTEVKSDLTVTKGSSLIRLSEYSDGAVIWLDGANGDLSGGDYYNIRANNNQQLTFGYAGNEHVIINSSGLVHFGGYPTSPSVAVGSPIKLRAGQGAWGISLGMRSSQNDYAYIGFTDMNGTEQIGDIYMQRTGTNTGHMVFSTNNGSGGSENRLRIANSGRLCYSPDASFAAESTNIAMSIACSGGDIGGYPGIHLRSTDSGGGTNSQNGMSIITTDGNWSLYTNAGSVHGLGIFAGNSANSSNAAFYARSDKKITMGPETSNEAGSSITCGQAVHIAGGSLGIGALSNYTTNSGEGGRYVLGWYHANAYTNRQSNAYLHLSTSLWGGGSPAGNSEFIMGGFKLKSYRYSPAGVAEEIIMFHNWSGGLPGYSRTYTGTWDPGNAAYVNSSGYVTLRLTSQNYVGYIIDLIQYNWYPVRDITVTSATFSNSSSI